MSTWGTSKFVILILQWCSIARLAVWCSIFSQGKSDSGSVVAKFESGMSVAYALGWSPSIKCKFFLENLRHRGTCLAKARYRIKDIVLGTKTPGSFIAALNFSRTATNISIKQSHTVFFNLFFSLNTFNVQIWNITKCKLLLMPIPRSPFIKVWSCSFNVWCISIFNWSDLRVWNRIEPPCWDLGKHLASLPPPAGLIFSLPSSLSIWQPHKLLTINSYSHLRCKCVIEKHSYSNDIRHQIVLVGSKQNRVRELLC